MLSKGEITKGMLITVHEWTVMKESFNLFGPNKIKPTQFVGSPLLVKGVTLPFIRVQVLDDPEKHYVTLNLGELDVMELSTDFLDNPEIMKDISFSSDDHIKDEQVEDAIQQSKVIYDSKYKR